MTIEAMKQALEALEHEAQIGCDDAYRVERDALRAAIEQQEKHEDWCASLTRLLLSMPPQPAPCNCKLKTAQRDPHSWQGLTDDEIKAPIQRAMQYFGFDSTQYSLGGAATIGFYGLVKEIETRLREKNRD